MKNKVKKESIDKEALDKVLNGNFTPEMQNQINLKMNAFMSMKVSDLLALLDFVNAIYSGSTLLITDNQTLLNARDKLQARLPDLKVLTRDEAAKLLPSKKKAESPGYLG